MVVRRHIENHFFGYNSAPLCLIKTKFRVRRHNRTHTKVRWRKCLISKIQHGGRPPFWISSQPQIIQIARNLVRRHKIYRRWWQAAKNSQIQKWRMDYNFLAITQLHVVSLIWNLERGGRITCIQSRSEIKCLITKIQNSGRQHCENGYTSETEPRFVQSWWNMLHKHKFWHSQGNMTNINLKWM